MNVSVNGISKQAQGLGVQALGNGRFESIVGPTGEIKT